MTIKLSINNFLWMVTGAMILLLIMLMVMHFQTKQSPSELLVLKSRRLDLLAQMRLALTTASEAEKSAVMALNDQDSKIFADQARKATEEVELKHKELTELLSSGGNTSERDLLVRFSKSFADLQRIDSSLLDLAGKNTNIKAFSLAFGPASDAIKEMSTALSGLVEKNASSPDAKNITLLALEAQIAALNIQTMIAPHISEESNNKMDELEAVMTREDQNVHKDFDGLATLLNLRGDTLLKTAMSDYTRFTEIKTHILSLSRENTNVRSLAISLGQKRKILYQCQDILSDLQQFIKDEPIKDLNYGIESNPRSLQVKKSRSEK